MARAVQPAGRRAEGRRLTGESDLAWRVEEACFLGWPALEQLRVGDWIVRCGGGVTRRINSANPATPDAASPAAHLQDVESLYRGWGLPPRFRIPSFIGGEVGRTLTAAGYEPESDILTLFAPIQDLEPAPDADVELAPRPSPEWLESKARLSEFSEGHADVYRRAVRRLALPAAFVALRQDEMLSAVAYGALHGRLLCLESVVTDPAARGKGFGRRMLRALFHWALLHGAREVCLQVEVTNAPGRSLYRRLGFEAEVYRYLYLTRWTA